MAIIDRDLIVRDLMKFGHSAQKAFEIAIDAERGDKYAVDWVNRALAYGCNQVVGKA